MKLTAWAALMAGLLILGCDPPPGPKTIDILSALSRGGSPEDCYALADRPGSIKFPGDLGPHPSFKTEWWYYTGNLVDASGRPFGFQLTFFRNALDCSDPEGTSSWRFRQLYFAHFAITDIKNKSFYSAQRMNRGSVGLAGAQSVPFRVWIDDWSAVQSGSSPDRLTLKAGERTAAKGESIQKKITLHLNLIRTKPAILQGKNGWSQKGPGPSDASYYYSFPGMKAEGSISLDQEEFRVSGRVWFDHEWSTSALGENVRGWDWFALHLTQGPLAGTDLMVCQVRQEDGRPNGFGFGSISFTDGQWIPLTEDQFAITPKSVWTSPLSKKKYPDQWSITIPGRDMAFEVKTRVPDQEHPHDFSYYEGAVQVMGQTGSGTGYVEMTGYEAR